MRIQKRNLMKDLIRVNFGFALVKCYSLGIVWPKKTSVYLINGSMRS